MKKVKFVKFDRKQIYDEHMAYDIERGLYPDLKIKKRKVCFFKKKERCLTVQVAERRIRVMKSNLNSCCCAFP
jgi:hypothetical protein